MVLELFLCGKRSISLIENFFIKQPDFCMIKEALTVFEEVAA